jgi:AcrR family transcriptional regulator
MERAEPKIPQRLSSLQQQQRQVTVDAIIRAAQRGIQEYGLDVTTDDIAALAEVGRRTVFRHFATREDLLHDAIAASFADLFSAIPAYSGGDWRAWLSELTRVIHHAAADVGRMTWELRTRRLPDRLAATHREQTHKLKQLFAATAATLWKAAGGHGPPPDQLRQTVAVHLSPLFTQAVLIHAEGTPELASELATNAIAATVHDVLNQ